MADREISADPVTIFPLNLMIEVTDPVSKYVSTGNFMTLALTCHAFYIKTMGLDTNCLNCLFTCDVCTIEDGYVNLEPYAQQLLYKLAENNDSSIENKNIDFALDFLWNNEDNRTKMRMLGFEKDNSLFSKLLRVIPLDNAAQKRIIEFMKLQLWLLDYLQIKDNSHRII